MLKQHCSKTRFSGNTNVIPLIRRRTLGVGRITILAIVLALASLAFVAKPDLVGSRGSAAHWTAEMPSAIGEFVYFPGQYVNQASAPTEHIQAF